MFKIEEKLENFSIYELCFILILLLIFFILPYFIEIEIPMEFCYIFCLAFVFYKLRDCKDSLSYDLHNLFTKISFKNFLIIVVANIFFSYAMLYLFYFSMDFFQISLASGIIISKSVIAFSLISSIIIAPFFEEILFRGILLSKFKNYFTPLSAVLILSLAFGFLHEPGSIISAFVFGICMSILFLKSNNILLPIAAHVFNNLCSEIIYYFDSDLLIFTNPFVMLLFFIIGIISAYLIIISIQQEFRKLN